MARGCWAPFGSSPGCASCAARPSTRSDAPPNAAPSARLVAEYEALLDEIAAALSPENHATAVELAALPLEIRGFGHIKEANLQRAKAKEADLLARFRSPSAPHALAAE